MKKRVLIWAFVLVLMMQSVVYGVTPRALEVTPTLTFSGTTATCKASVFGDNQYTYLVVTMKLWSENRCLGTWTKAGTEYVLLTQTATVTRGKTYTLTVDVMVNGISSPQSSITKTY